MRLNLYKSGTFSCSLLAMGVTALSLTGLDNDNLAQIGNSLDYGDDGQFIDDNLHIFAQTYGSSKVESFVNEDDDSDAVSDDDDLDDSVSDFEDKSVCSALPSCHQNARSSSKCGSD